MNESNRQSSVINYLNRQTFSHFYFGCRRSHLPELNFFFFLQINRYLIFNGYFFFFSTKYKFVIFIWGGGGEGGYYPLKNFENF